MIARGTFGISRDCVAAFADAAVVALFSLLDALLGLLLLDSSLSSVLGFRHFSRCHRRNYAHGRDAGLRSMLHCWTTHWSYWSYSRWVALIQPWLHSVFVLAVVPDARLRGMDHSDEPAACPHESS